MRTKNKECHKHRKDDSSDPSLSDDFDLSDDSHYRRKQRKDNKNRKKDPIRLCATLTANFLTTAHKSKIIGFKMDEDPLQRRIYFLTFIDSLDMIFHSTEKIEGMMLLSITQKRLSETSCMQTFMQTSED